ncbi:class D beta-lactamase [Paraburkholderia sp. Se-20369]|nr:class D beta-lactamase [Paraburkholderia sp. Se-20369]
MPKPLQRTLFALAAACALAAASAHAKPLCTLVADAATGQVLIQQGDCATRVTSASTFKVAISLMGYDAGFLKDTHAPTLDYRDGYPDWGGAAWREPTDPARWMRISIFWYSQQVAQALGQARFQQYTSAFGYGNADVTSPRGELNGVMGAWANGSLQISPLEQVAFMRKVVNRTLPVSAHAYDMTARLTQIDAQPGGWTVHGKTGTGSPGVQYDAAHAYGWFVGWATKGARTLVFANLIQDEKPQRPNAGMRSRDAFLDALPALADSAQPR